MLCTPCTVIGLGDFDSREQHWSISRECITVNKKIIIIFINLFMLQRLHIISSDKVSLYLRGDCFKIISSILAGRCIFSKQDLVLNQFLLLIFFRFFNYC